MAKVDLTSGIGFQPATEIIQHRLENAGKLCHVPTIHTAKIMLHRKRFFLLTLIQAFSVASVGFCQTSNSDEPNAQASAASEVKQPAQLFDIQVPRPTAKPGEYVLCPSRQFYDSAVKRGVEKTTFIYYAAKMVEVGDSNSTVTNLAGRKFQIPNQLIISIPPKQECQKGDVLMTWWQAGSGMQRAIVVGGTEIKPIVRYLDITLDNPSGAGKKEDTLKPDSFVVLNNEWQIGSSVAIKEGRRTTHGVIVATSEKQVLVREFAGKLKCHERKNASPIPIKADVVAGDIAMASVHGTFLPVTVTKVDAEIGRVFTNFQLGRKDQERVFAFGDIFKEQK